MLANIQNIYLSKILIIIGFFGGSLHTCGQSTLSSKSKKAIAYYQEADNYRVRRQYEQAVVLLENAIVKDDQFIEAYQRLADIYLALNKLELAEKQYQKSIEIASYNSKYADAHLYIAEIQIILEKYRLAKANTERFLNFKLKNQKKNDQAKLLLSKANYSLENIQSPLPFNPISLNKNINQFEMQYFPVVTADQKTLLYTKRDGNALYDDEDIMISTKDENGEWGVPESISQNINSELNEGTCAISADGRTLVFTSCEGRNSYGSCDLFISHKKGDEWSKPVNMGSTINSTAWESQPSLSADGRRLYFVSNRKGGFGGRDIWVSTQKQGKWMSPVNLGNKINTPNEEVSPFIHPNSKILYFASDGLVGFGGFDLFYTELNTGKTWNSPSNLGYPINRGTDQMSLVITADGSTGLYSDSGGNYQQLSSIKQFDVPEQIRIKHKSRYVKGVVTDRKTKKPLEVQVQLYDVLTNELIGQVHADSISGEYLMVLTEGGNYALYIEKSGYVFQSVNFDFQKKETKKQQPLIIDIELMPISKGAITILNNVFFEYDSYELDKKSLVELDKVAQFMKDNRVKLEIGGYADRTGREAYNQMLSEKRAKSVYDYLINEKRIPQNELIYRGYGQDKTNKFGQLEFARRIEFKLL